MTVRSVFSAANARLGNPPASANEKPPKTIKRTILLLSLRMHVPTRYVLADITGQSTSEATVAKETRFDARGYWSLASQFWLRKIYAIVINCLFVTLCAVYAKHK